MNIHVKYCKRCGKAFDQGTNFDLCPKCRKDLELKRWKENNKELVKKMKEEFEWKPFQKKLREYIK